MSGDITSVVPAHRIDTLVADPVTGEERRRTDYAGTVWYDGGPQMGGAVVSRGRAQISASFRLPDSHVYNAETAADAQLQATASVQSTVE